MARKPKPITVKAVVEIYGKTYDLDEMTEEQRMFVGTHIKMALLNGINEGRAVFSAPELPDPKTLFGD